jgi:membrane protein
MASVDDQSRHARPDSGRSWLARTIAGRGHRRIREIDLDTHALALCAQLVLCAAPLIVAMGAVSQRLTGRGAAYYITRFFGLQGVSETAVDHLFARTNSISTLALVLSMAGSLALSTGIAAVQQRAFERIWTLPRIANVRSYIRQLSWAVALGCYSLIVLGVSRVGRELTEAIGWAGLLIVAVAQGIGTFVFYWWSQRWLLAGRVTWRALLPGSLAVGVLTTIIFRLTRVFLPGQIAWPVRAYGLIGGVFVLSAWLMVLSVVIFGGVLFGALLVERRALVAEAPSPLTPEGLASAAGVAEAARPAHLSR